MRGICLADHVVPGGPLVILYSNDLERSCEAVKLAGGTITTETFSFPGGRRFHFRDPSGNVLACGRTNDASKPIRFITRLELHRQSARSSCRPWRLASLILLATNVLNSHVCRPHTRWATWYWPTHSSSAFLDP